MWRLVTVVFVVSTILASTTHVCAAETAFVRPVPGPIIRTFDMSNGPYGRGHRGIDLASAVGSPVRAARSGTVTFAGSVAGTRYVTIASAAGLETRYGPLADVRVHAREQVRAGHVIATVGQPPSGADPHLGFAVVIGGAYVDPAPYLSSARVHLTPLDTDDERRRSRSHTASSAAGLAVRLDEIAASAQALLADVNAQADELAALVDNVRNTAARLQVFKGDVANEFDVVVRKSVRAEGTTQINELRDRLGTVLIAADNALGRLRDLQESPRRLLQERIVELRETSAGGLLEKPVAELEALFTITDSLAMLATELSVVGPAMRVLDAVADYERNRRDCTPGTQAPATFEPPAGRQVLAVEGFTSVYDGVEAGNLATMLAELGYADDRIVRFSYAGHAPDGTPHAYEAIDTSRDIEMAARLLGEQLKASRRADPRATFDLVGHSLGGVVIAFFLAHVYDPADDGFPPLSATVTLNSPLQGVPLAQLGELVGQSDLLGPALVASESLEDAVGVPADVEAIGQLAQTSLFIYRLRSAWDFNGVDVTAIGTTSDWLVPAATAHHDAARHNVVVDAPEVGDPLDAHSAVRDDPEARAAVVLALSGQNPLCLDLVEFAGRRARSELAHFAEQYAAFELGLVAVFATEVA